MLDQVYYAATAAATGKDPRITIPTPPGNPPPGPHYEHVFLHTTRAACITFWVLFGVFTAGLLGVAFLSFKVPRKDRVFHFLSGAALAITAMTYLGLATGLGMNPPSWFFHGGRPHGPHGPPHRHPGGPGLPVPPGHGHPGHDHEGLMAAVMTMHHESVKVFHRQRLYARDFAHVFIAPLYIAQLAILSGMAPLAGLIAALAGSAASFAAAVANGFARRHSFRPQWLAWFIVALLWTAVVFAYLLVSGGDAARRRAAKTRARFFLLTLLLVVAYATYGVFSLLGPGLEITSVDVDAIVLGITDVAAQLGFTYFLLLTHVHDDQDPNFTFPAWISEPRGGHDGRGTYAAVAASSPDTAN